MRRDWLAGGISAFVISLCSVCAAQWPSNVAGVPFTAFETQTSTTPAKTTTASGVIARRPDGSCYSAVTLSSSTDPGDHVDRKWAWFNDIPAHKNYTLFLFLNNYQVFPTDLQARPHSMRTAAEYLHDRGGDGFERTVGDVHIEVLGIRKIEGFETVGELQTRTDGRTNENWYSPELEMYLLRKAHDPKVGDFTDTIGQIKLGEPDAKLFKLPDGFTLAPPPRSQRAPATSSPPQTN